MVQFEAWLLRGLLGLLWVLPVWTNTIPQVQCTALRTIKDQLNSTLRRRYLKQNFPINYTIQVPYEEVFRLHNISRLSKTEDVQDKHLQHLWLTVAKAGIKRIVRVLPERHPTRRKYLTELEHLFRIYEQSFGTKTSEEDVNTKTSEEEVSTKSPEEDDFPDIITDILDRIGIQNLEGWRSVTPKSLIDNCYRSMHCLFKECFSTVGDNSDYCDIYHWRKRKGTTPQPT